MLTQIGKTFFFVGENIIIFYIPLLFFVELTAVTMQCNSCLLLDQWLYQRKRCVQLVPLSKRNIDDKGVKRSLGINSVSLSYITTLSTKFTSARITHTIYNECGHRVKLILTIHLSLWDIANPPFFGKF